MSARVEGLIEEDGEVRGVRYRSPEDARELRAGLVVGADGRFSKVRELAGIGLEELSAGTDVLYFNVPRRPDDAAGAVVDIHFGPTNSLALIDRGTYWQAGYTIPKGGYQKAREAGVGPVKDFVGRAVPWLSDRLDAALPDWDRVTLLSVKTARAERWHRPGLLLIGDAAHVMSLSGGVGINLAVQDAVAAANALTGPLKARRVTEADLAEVRRRCEWQVALVQGQQVAAEGDIARSFEAGKPYEARFALKLLTRLPVLGALPAWVTAYGVLPERLEPALVGEAPRPGRTAGFETLRGRRYANLTTFRKSGEGVRTPVWFAEGASGGELYVYTMGDSGKAKRVRNGGGALVGPSDRRGGALGTEEPAVACILPPGEEAAAEAALNRKYGLQKRAFGLVVRALGKAQGRVYLGIAPAPDDAARTTGAPTDAGEEEVARLSVEEGAK